MIRYQVFLSNANNFKRINLTHRCGTLIGINPVNLGILITKGNSTLHNWSLTIRCSLKLYPEHPFFGFGEIYLSAANTTIVLYLIV